MRPFNDRTATRRRAWNAALAVLTLPLLQTAACIDRAQRSIINGVFDAIIPIVVSDAERRLGLDRGPEMP